MTELTSRKKTPVAAAAPMLARPMRLWQDRSNAQEVRIEVIPLIDVIFCILTFFILAALSFSRQQAINLDLPKASTGKPQMREMLVVSLDNIGQVYIEKELVTRNQLYQALKNYELLNPNGTIVLNASRDASYNEVIQVLDMLRQVGGDRVALATLPGKAGVQEASNDSLPYGTQFPGGNFNSMPSTTPPLNPGQWSGTPGLNQYNPLTPRVPVPPGTMPGTSSNSVPDRQVR